jgi:hypothetical protein
MAVPVFMEYLAGQLAKTYEVEVRSFGDQEVNNQNPSIEGYVFEEQRFAKADLQLKAHTNREHRNSHEYQTCRCRRALSHLVLHFAGILAKLWHSLVVITHSLEPPAQNNNGDASSWIEKTAIEM